MEGKVYMSAYYGVVMDYSHFSGSSIRCSKWPRVWTMIVTIVVDNRIFIE